jgi:hypothetical protein
VAENNKRIDGAAKSCDRKLDDAMESINMFAPAKRCWAPSLMIIKCGPKDPFQDR